MNTTSRAGWLLAAFMLAAGWLTAQSSVQDDLQRADKQFDLYAYNLALRTYEQVLQKDPNNARALSRTADCYFQLDRPEEALPWYERAAQQYNVEPVTFLNYGKALMQTADYTGAKKWFRVYGENNPSAAQQYINMCDYAIDVSRKEGLYTVKNEPLNTESADYCATFLGNRVVYSSSRTDIARKSQPKTGSDWSGSAYNQLYVTQRSAESGSLQKPTFLRSDLQNTFNEGPVSFSADGKKVAFCRNNFIDGTRQIAEKGINMSLYVAEVVDGNWLNIKAFPFNGSDYATGFPALSPDGNTLIFASNQPGGSGGWDIYVSNWTGSTWSTPRNIGEPLNTPGNEVTPFYDGKDLYFSSDWHKGLGGLDVFRAELGRETVTNVYHLGPGVNSSRDDYGFVFDGSQNIGYVTSTRPTGRGHEDIWQVVKKNSSTTQAPATYSTSTNPFSQNKTNTNTNNLTPQEYSTTVTNYGSGSGTLFLQVTDKAGNPVPNADLDFSDCNAGFGQTDYEGKYYFSALNWPLRCNVVIKKEGFIDDVVLLESYGKGNLLIAITPDARKEYIGAVRDARSRALLDGVSVEINKTETGQVVITNTDYTGRYSLFLTPFGSYDVLYAKEGYKSSIVKVRPGAAGTSLSDINLEPIIGIDRPAEYNTQTSTALISSKKAEELTSKGDFNGYAVQVAAYPDELTEAKLKKYEELSKFGNLYAKSEAGRNKVRLGIFSDKTEAQEALKKVLKNPKFKGSFITEEYGADPALVLGSATTDLRPTEYSTVSKGAPTASAIRYSVQLGSFAADRPIEIGDFTKAADLGHLYTKLVNGMNKVRLGVYPTHAAAEQAQAELVAKGYQDAIIVTEKTDDESLRAFMIGESLQPAQYSTPNTAAKKAKLATDNVVRPTEYSTATNLNTKVYPYYVRLVTLNNPERFDSSPFNDLGGIERRKSETGATIILLGGYENIEGVSAALRTVRNRGFEEAYAVVKDAKGNLTRIK
ncbi:MAG: PD40 domain-containing protein [Saprospiraceae bacterium]|nr:PD40 domain-containing protein [Saprospiraceae bacterium]